MTVKKSNSLFYLFKNARFKDTFRGGVRAMRAASPAPGARFEAGCGACGDLIGI